MNHARIVRLAAFFCTSMAVLSAQSLNPAVTVPRTVRYTGSFRPADGLPLQPMEGVTIAVYRDQTGGDPLWQETQNVSMDTSGNFAVEMGATLNEGLPLDLLRKGEPRWVGVRINRPCEGEQPRVQMLSVPYALRASDAETLGGLPASAYLVNPSTPATSGPATTSGVKPRATSGTSNYLGLFTNTTDLSNSVLYQNGGKIGLNTVNPPDYFHVGVNDATGNFTGYSVQNLGSGARSYSGMLFYDQNGALTQFQGFNNSTHEYRINNIASNASINFMIGSLSKFQVRSDGDIDIAGSIRKGGALFLHNLGIFNTGIGLNALAANTTGTYNTANGYGALGANTAGFDNTAVGTSALVLNTIGAGNTPIGTSTLVFRTGNQNTALGYGALSNNTSGNGNSGSGYLALSNNTTGHNNTSIGVFALTASTGGASNIGVGFSAGSLMNGGNSNIEIGNIGASSDDKKIHIGDVQTSTLIAGISGATTGAGDAVTVVIDSNGQLGTINSSRRFKEDIRDMGDASSNLLHLRPVYKQPYADGSKPLDYGLIAEEVGEVYPDLVVTNKDGQVETVQYQKLTPMLLNELQKQAELIRKLEARLAALESAKVSATAESEQ